MHLAEPAPTRFDVFFKVGSIPIRIHPLFWLITSILGLISAVNAPGGPGQAAANLPVHLMIWLVAVLFSLVVHELGHGWAAQHYGWPPRICMYGMGGVTMYEPRRPTIASRIIIALAGPFAGFTVGGLILGSLLAFGYTSPLLGLHTLTGGTILGGRLGLFVADLLMINFFWGFLNLMPIQPMDGGSVVQAVLEKFRPRSAMRTSFQIGVATAAILVVVSLVLWQSTFLAVMFGVMGYNNWQYLNATARHGW